MGNRQRERYSYYDCDCDDCDSDYEYVGDNRLRVANIGGKPRQEWREEPKDDHYDKQVERARRMEDGDPDEYAVVPAKAKIAGRPYDEPIRKAIMSAQDIQEREMGQLKMEEQKIKNQIASERLAFDVQKRQQSKELHDIKVAVIKKYPTVILNKQAPEQ